MDKDRHSGSTDPVQVEKLLMEALEFEDSAERLAFIEKASTGNKVLHGQIIQTLESLIANADDFFSNDSPLWISAEDLFETLSSSREFYPANAEQG